MTVTVRVRGVGWVPTHCTWRCALVHARMLNSTGVAAQSLHG